MKSVVENYLQENYKLITREDYRNCALSDNTKKILCDVGLPYEPFCFVKFNIEEIENIKLDEEHIIIGNDFDVNICINKRGEVVVIDTKNEYPTRFINKNLESFLHFIIIFLSYKDKMNEADNDEINQIVQEIRTEFDIIDIQALSNEENWWSTILEEIELGVM